jgi:L-amino acid N-acyltransferase YncA
LERALSAAALPTRIATVADAEAIRRIYNEAIEERVATLCCLLEWRLEG